MSASPLARALLLGLGLSGAGCASLADVTPGEGRRAEVTGRAYAEVWKAALEVADEEFVVREDDPEKGVILAERVKHAWPWREYVGIFIVPPTAGVERYTVEVVFRRPIAREGWEERVLADVRRALRAP